MAAVTCCTGGACRSSWLRAECAFGAGGRRPSWRRGPPLRPATKRVATAMAAPRADPTTQPSAYVIGVDFGTSGARAAAVPLTSGLAGSGGGDGAEANTGPSFESRVGYEYERHEAAGCGRDAARCSAWRAALREVLLALPGEVRAKCRAVAVDGTSATTVVAGMPMRVSEMNTSMDSIGGTSDRDNRANEASERVTDDLWGDIRFVAMYDEAFPEGAAAAAAIAPPAHTAAAPTAALAKLLHWRGSLPEGDARALNEALEGGVRPVAVTTQADFLAALLRGDGPEAASSDWNNALKLGFDPGAAEWPAWLREHPLAPALPREVLPPGARSGAVGAAPSEEFGLPIGCFVAAGTTDSIAAFLAASSDFSGGAVPGDAVVSLGSTLAIKLVSSTRVDDASRGIYSHRLGDGTWLVGGASNSGGKALLEHFSAAEMERISTAIDPDIASALAEGFYPLPSGTSGERFPVADVSMVSVTAPRPESDADFLHALLEAIARIERRGFGAMASLGASEVCRVRTAGGGARNDAWTSIRRRVLGVEVETATQLEACHGAARLAAMAAAGERVS